MEKLSTIYTTIREIEIDLDIDVFFLDSRVFTTSDPSKIYKYHKKENGKKYLCISIEIQLEDFESVLDGAAYARPRLLIIFGILTFLTQELFTPFESYSSSTSVGTLKKRKIHKFKFNKLNYLLEFKKIALLTEFQDESEKRLFYSLIDRYRKALYLEEESEGNMIHDDEVLLSYFHILELLSDRYYTQQKRAAFQLIHQFTDKLLKDIYLLEGNQLQEELSAKRSLVKNVFKSELPVGSKIMYMFKEQGILTYRLKSLISELIKDRNSVAHGRQVYQERVIFPVPPFFPIIRNRGYSFEVLRILSGRAISLFIKINHFKQEWEEVDRALMPTFDELSLFINEKKYEKLPIDDFYSGKINDITPHTLAYYLLNKKLKAKNAIPVLSNIIMNYREIEDEITELVLAVILIVDNSKGELKEKCIDIIKLSSNKDWLPLFKMRDILSYLEYLEHEPKTLREMITKREIK